MDTHGLNKSKLHRSLSIGGSLEEDTTDGNFSVRPQRISDHISNITPLEEIVTCPIHLGIMENPRKLKCQHAFCYECLLNFVKVNSRLFCPICRATEDSTDVNKLPIALVEKQLVEVVMQQRLAKCGITSNTEMNKERKEELVKHLLKDLKHSSSAVFRFNEPTKNCCSTSETINRLNIPMVASASTIYNSTYDMMDVEAIRENMLYLSAYTDVKRKSIKKFCKGYKIKKNCTAPVNLLAFDVHLMRDRAESYEVVFIDSNTNQIYVYSETEYRNFSIYIEGMVVKAFYIRISHNDLYVTGYFDNHGTQNSIFVQCNMYGRIIRKSEVCTYLDNNSRIPMMTGFDIDSHHEKFYVCLPHLNRINVYNTSLIECTHPFQLNGNQPEFVTFHPSQNQIWVSCPQNRRIVIVDTESGALMMFCTDLIDNAVPHMIYCTDEERIIFLDGQSNRFIWIKRRGDYILTQKLSFRSVSEGLEIKAFQVLPASQIVVGTSGEFLVFQPVRMKGKLKPGASACTLF